MFIDPHCLYKQTRPQISQPLPHAPPRPPTFLGSLKSFSLTRQISRVLSLEGGDLEAVKKKFSSSKFGSVASMKVNVLPDDLL